MQVRKDFNSLVHAAYAAKYQGNWEPLKVLEAKGLTGATDAGGGYLVRPLYLMEVIQLMNLYGDALVESNVVTVPKRYVKSPKVIGSTTAYMLATETATVTASAFTLDQLASSILACASLVIASNDLVADADFDITSLVDYENAKAFAYRMDLEYFIGDSFTGIMKASGTVPVSVSGGAAGLKYDDFVNATKAVPKQYRRGAKFYGNRAIAGYVAKMKSSIGIPLFVPAPNADIPDRILGFPFEEIEAMPDSDFSNGMMIFGNLKATTKIFIRQDMTVDVLKEASVVDENSATINLATSRQTGILTVMRFAPEIEHPEQIVIMGRNA